MTELARQLVNVTNCMMIFCVFILINIIPFEQDSLKSALIL